MPRMSSEGRVTIPKEVRDVLGLEPGDEISFVKTESGYEIRTVEPATADGDDPFETYRGSDESDESLPERMRRLRAEYPRDVDCDESWDTSSST